MIEAAPPRNTFTPAQDKARQLLGGHAEHVMLYGGARSGKTFVHMAAILTRAVRADGSRHGMFRNTVSEAKSSLWMDTLPKTMDLRFPGLRHECQVNSSDLFIKFPNGSEIWVGGLDDDIAVEKHLGKEYSTIYFNEASNINFGSVLKMWTRLAQKSGLVNKAYYDCNPPNTRHWVHDLFIKHINPRTGDKVDASNYVSMLMNPKDNLVNLPDNYISILESLPERERRRFLLGEFVDNVDGVIFSAELQTVKNEKRFRETLPNDKYLKVITAWDLGKRDKTAIWFARVLPDSSVHLIDYYENSSQHISHYIDYVDKVGKERGYHYKAHYWPHDGFNDWLDNSFAQRVWDQYKWQFIMLERKAFKKISHDQARRVFPRCYFDSERCGQGIDQLYGYTFKYDRARGAYSETDIDKNGCDHGADAFQYLCQAVLEFEAYPEKIAFRNILEKDLYQIQNSYYENTNKPLSWIDL